MHNLKELDIIINMLILEILDVSHFIQQKYWVLMEMEVLYQLTSEKLLKKIRQIRFYGIEQHDKKINIISNITQNVHGINSRLDEIHSSILNFKLKKVRNFILKRKNS